MAAPREMSETRYVDVGDADVAYRVVGDGPVDLLWFDGLGSHVDMDEGDPNYSWQNVLKSFSRLILFDRRGTGASDGLARNAKPAWEEWADDLRAVLDAAGSDTTAISATGDAGPIAIMFAALHPARVSALILDNTSARFLRADDYPIGMSQARVDAVVEMVASLWGTEEFLAVQNPGLADDGERARAWPGNTGLPRPRGTQPLSFGTSSRTSTSARFCTSSRPRRWCCTRLRIRSSASTTAATSPVTSQRRGLLKSPAWDRPRWSRGSACSRGGHRVLDRGASAVDVDRVLTTVLFTDIVASTEQLASVGDRRWRAMLDAHDRAVREQLHRFRGREIKTTGDGFHACFDGPGRAIGCARSITQAAQELGIEVRAGLHTGECEIRGDDLAGLAVHLAARIGSLARPGEVLVSTTVKDLVAGSGIEFVDRGDHELKGIPATWRLYAVEDSARAPSTGYDCRKGAPQLVTTGRVSRWAKQGPRCGRRRGSAAWSGLPWRDLSGYRSVGLAKTARSSGSALRRSSPPRSSHFVAAWRLRPVHRPAVAAAVLAAVLLFAAGEEISWGQRIFEVDTPEVLVDSNKQDELNLHNLVGLQHKAVAGQLAIAGGGLLLALRVPRRWARVGAPFFAGYLMYRATRGVAVIADWGPAGRNSEAAEVMLGFGLLALTVALVADVRRLPLSERRLARSAVTHNCRTDALGAS